jgi:ribosomal protein S18 acetylase RimI-like enzyme
MDIVEIDTFTDAVLQALNGLLAQLSQTAPALNAAALRRVIAAADTHLLMARQGGVYCGSATLVIVVIPSGQRARIEDVVVSRSMRGRGIGRGLVDRALALARELGAHSVELTSHPSRVAANALYRKMGFVQRETTVYHYRL